MKFLVKIILIVFILNSVVVYSYTGVSLKNNNLKNQNKSIVSLNNLKKDNIKKSKIDAIKAWKEKKRKMINEIYQQTNISSLMDLNDAAKQLSDISSKLENLNISYLTIKKQKNNIDKKYKAVLKEVKDIILQLDNKNKLLKTKLLSIQILSKELKDMKAQIKNIDDTIYISKKEIEKYIGLLYKINNDYYDSLNDLDNIKLLFKSNNIAETLSKEDIIKILSLRTQDLLSKLEKSRNIKNKFLKKMYSKRVEYINMVNEYKNELKVLNGKRKFLVDLLLMLKKNKKNIDSVYNKLYKKRYIFKRQQIKLLNSINGTGSDILSQTGSKIIDLSAILKYTSKTDGDKFLSWPVTIYPKLSATFKDPKYFKKFGWEHDGIDIKIPQLSPIYSAAAGYVYKVVDNNSDHYNYIVIVHNYGYITIYGHIFKALVKQGTIVQRGQLIAVSGGEKGIRGSGKLSTGPHLHFEVYKNGQLIDPLSVLDLSVYKDKSDLPKKWQLKYLKDTLTRRINLDGIRFLSNKFTHEEREKIFLKLRGANGFNNLTGWIQPSKKFGIDPDVAICIGYAETGLGNHTASKYNVGNVGNNDRGDRKEYPTPEAGINAIYYALNNKYLSKYHTIDKLSRWGNKDSHIFSSSSYNWEKNVVRCLSILKGYPVSEYFPFRIPNISLENKIKQLYLSYSR